MNKSESKYFNTAKKMDEAFLSLLQKKEFSYITVKEICEVAGVSRSAFYLHYETMGDLLQETIALLNERFTEAFTETPKKIQVKNAPKEELNFIDDAYLIPYLNFAKTNKYAYKAIHEQSNIFDVEKAYESMFQNVFSPVMSKYGVSKDRQKYMMAFFRRGLVAIVMQWIDGGCTEPTEEIAQIMKSCVNK